MAKFTWFNKYTTPAHNSEIIVQYKDGHITGRTWVADLDWFRLNKNVVRWCYINSAVALIDETIKNA